MRFNRLYFLIIVLSSSIACLPIDPGDLVDPQDAGLSDAGESSDSSDQDSQPSDQDSQPEDQDSQTNDPVCNNGVVEGSEKCDSNTIVCAEFDPNLYVDGLAPCNGTCTDWDFDACIEHEDPDQPVDIGAEPDEYLSFAEIQNTFQQWADAAPFVEYGTFGTSNGYENVYIRISIAVREPNRSLPKVLIHSCTHGDEWIATASVVGVTHRIISNFGTDPTLTELVNSRDIYVVPVVSPSGYESKSRYVDGKDPNRSFPTLQAPNNVPTKGVRNLINLFIDKEFSAVIHYHASGGMVLLPWAYTKEKLVEGQDGDKHRSLGKKLGQVSGYRWGSLHEVMGVTGTGGAMDWFYQEGKKRGFKTVSVGLETGNSKIPSESQIPKQVDVNYKILQVFIDEAPILL